MQNPYFSCIYFYDSHSFTLYLVDLKYKFILFAMKKLLGLNPIYERMKRIHLIDYYFEDLNMSLIRKLAYESTIDKTGKMIKQILPILDEENNSSLLTLKTFLFLNTLLNINSKSQDDSVMQTVSDQINKLLETQKKRLANIQKSRIHVSSVEKTMKWIKGRLSVSKHKNQIEIKNKGVSNIYGITEKSKITQQSARDKNLNGAESQSTNLQGKQELLIEKIIVPYAAYLQKLAFAQINFSSPELQVQEIWKIINLIKSLYQTTNAFQAMARYYGRQYMDVLFFAFHMVDYETKIMYPLLEKHLKPKIQKANQLVQKVYEKQKNQRKRTQLLKEISQKYAFNQLKELLDQVSTVNQMIVCMYLGRNTYQQSKIRGFNKPQLFSDPKSFSFIYDVVKDVQKCYSLSKKLTCQKEKRFSNQITSKINPEVQFAKDNKTPIFTQKKQKLAQKISSESCCLESNDFSKNNSNLETTQPIQKQITVNQQKTFRKMRLNATNQDIHLRETNSRILKL